MATIVQHHFNRYAEWVSIGVSAVLMAVAAYFFFLMPGWAPAPNALFWVYALGWMVFGYLAIQLYVLLKTALDSRSIGFVDSLVSLGPTLLGAIVVVESLQGIIKLSNFQDNALWLMICTSLLEAVITLWVRFTVNRRTIGLDAGSN